ncbi:MAG: tetratricopeptide repeat protein [Oscillospiraceae bacterium]|nr:tetratricopeptide repeat protein [Oscillospiraceae bacterium]
MGGSFRRYTKQLGKIAVLSGFPCTILFLILMAVLTAVQKEETVFSPLLALRFLAVCYAAGFFLTCVVKYQSLIHAAIRPDAHLIQKNFNGLRMQDRMFCDGMDQYAQNHPRQALDYFLEVQKMELTASESGVLSFYIGRCYQLLNCPSHAISYYQKAGENGFSKPFAQLFEARSQAESGCFEESYRLFCDILEHDPPKEFYFLYTDIGYLFVKQKMPDQAEEWFQRSIQEKQNYAFALSGMAIVSLQRGQFKAAQDYHYRALVNKLENPTAFLHYYEDTKTLMLNAHPEWDSQTGCVPAEAAEQTEHPDAEEYAE